MFNFDAERFMLVVILVLAVMFVFVQLQAMRLKKQNRKLQCAVDAKVEAIEGLNEVDDALEWRGVVEGADVRIEKKDQCVVIGVYKGRRGDVMRIESREGEIVSFNYYDIKTATVKWEEKGKN